MVCERKADSSRIPRLVRHHVTPDFAVADSGEQTRQYLVRVMWQTLPIGSVVAGGLVLEGFFVPIRQRCAERGLGF